MEEDIIVDFLGIKALISTFANPLLLSILLISILFTIIFTSPTVISD